MTIGSTTTRTSRAIDTVAPRPLDAAASYAVIPKHLREAVLEEAEAARVAAAEGYVPAHDTPTVAAIQERGEAGAKAHAEVLARHAALAVAAAESALREAQDETEDRERLERAARKGELGDVVTERDQLRAEVVRLRADVTRLRAAAEMGWGTARAFAIQYGARASERAADEALATLSAESKAPR